VQNHGLTKKMANKCWPQKIRPAAFPVRVTPAAATDRARAIGNLNDAAFYVTVKVRRHLLPARPLARRGSVRLNVRVSLPRSAPGPGRPGQSRAGSGPGRLGPCSESHWYVCAVQVPPVQVNARFQVQFMVDAAAVAAAATVTPRLPASASASESLAADGDCGP
jgi:hypothetical protein